MTTTRDEPSDLSVTLSSLRKMPSPGFGVYRSWGDRCLQSCTRALAAGYRHIDTGQFYNNEAEVGEAIRRSGIPRAEIFITTKLLTPQDDFDKTYSQCLQSIAMLDSPSGYVDLFLIHSPHRGREKRMFMWQVMEALYVTGFAKSIGVSNFGIQHIEEIRECAVWPPHVNQIEVGENVSIRNGPGRDAKALH